MRSCARVRLVLRGSVSSDVSIGGACWLMSLLFVRDCRQFCTVVVCMVLMFVCMLSFMSIVGSVGMLVMYVFWVWNMVFFICLGGGF